MLVPLYESVYDRLEVGTGTRLLALGCGSGLSLLLAAARGAVITGCEADERRLALARERLLPQAAPGARRARPRSPRLLAGSADALADELRRGGPGERGERGDSRGRGGSGGRAGFGDVADFDVVTAFDPAVPEGELRPALAAVARSAARRGGAVVLAGWGPPERCATSRVLAVAARLAEPRAAVAYPPRLSGRDDLEELTRFAGLRPDGSGRVSCPFGYADLASAVRGLLSTGLFDAAVEATDQQQVEKELAEALHPFRRADGTVRMENVFRYVVARA